MATDWSAEITAQIISQIEAQPGAFIMPWHRLASERRAMPYNAVTQHQYSGMNVFLLGMAGMGHETDRWATFKQWQERGRCVAKGSKGYKIIFYKALDVEDENAAPNADGERIKKIPMMRVYTVFNEDQLDGYEAAEAEPVAMEDLTKSLDNAEAFIAATGARITDGGGRAFYAPATDHIGMPARARFTGSPTSTPTESYYSTLLHELTHWTGAKQRCGRDFSRDRKAYAFEELIAELGAAFLCRKLHISLDPRPDHAQYLAHWLEILKGDKRAIFRAAAAAQRAIDFLDGLQQPAALPALANPLQLDLLAAE